MVSWICTHNRAESLQHKYSWSAQESIEKEKKQQQKASRYPLGNISNSKLLKITKKKKNTLKNRLPSAAIILLPLADSEAPGKSEPTLTGSSSPAEKLYHFLKLISPEYYESKEPHSETQWPAKKYICLPFVRDWQWKDSRTEYYSTKTFQGIKCCIKRLIFVTAPPFSPNERTKRWNWISPSTWKTERKVNVRPDDAALTDLRLTDATECTSEAL